MILKRSFPKSPLILKTFGGIFDIDNKNKTIADLSAEMSIQDFWNNEAHSTKVVKLLKVLKSVVEPWGNAHRKYQELKELQEITQEKDADLIADLEKNIQALISEVGSLEFKTLLGGEKDPNNAILSINAGAGGTESCDWVEMLLRMYSRWAESKGHSVRTIDILPGEEAGIKNVVILVEGEYAYGFLKSERGVHRLVRISPFDANKRRHTSFASVDVIPEIEDTSEIVIEDRELEIETFRASGAGGQHMQKSDTAVRITHKPSGISVQCQNERSQSQNKQTALKVLKARLYEQQLENKEKELEKIRGEEKKKIEWGSQIRSYVLYPYTLVKDHRTDYESGNSAAVLDGALDPFMEAYLKSQKERKNL